MSFGLFISQKGIW